MNRPTPNHPEHDDTLTRTALRVGRYVHPRAGWRLTVTRARIDRWVDAFRRMRKAGLTVDVTLDHRPTVDARIGEVVELWREGDHLLARHRIPSPDHRALAERAPGVSLEIEPRFVDGLGRAFGSAIVASSFVRQPLIQAQPLQPDLATPDPRKPIMSLTPPGPEDDTIEPTPGDPTDSMLRSQPGDDTSDAAPTDRLNLSRAELHAELDHAAALLAESARARLDALVDRGAIAPVVRDRLADVLIGPPDRPSLRCLSRAAGHAFPGQDDPAAPGGRALFHQVCDALAAAPAAPDPPQHDATRLLGERTGPQAGDAMDPDQTRRLSLLDDLLSRAGSPRG